MQCGCQTEFRTTNIEENKGVRASRREVKFVKGRVKIEYRKANVEYPWSVVSVGNQLSGIEED